MLPHLQISSSTYWIYCEEFHYCFWLYRPTGTAGKVIFRYQLTCDCFLLQHRTAQTNYFILMDYPSNFGSMISGSLKIWDCNETCCWLSFDQNNGDFDWLESRILNTVDPWSACWDHSHQSVAVVVMDSVDIDPFNRTLGSHRNQFDRIYHRIVVDVMAMKSVWRSRALCGSVLLCE